MKIGGPVRLLQPRETSTPILTFFQLFCFRVIGTRTGQTDKPMDGRANSKTRSAAYLIGRVTKLL